MLHYVAVPIADKMGRKEAQLSLIIVGLDQLLKLFFKLLYKPTLNKDDLHFFISNLGFCLELGLLNCKTKIGTGVA